MAWKKGITIIGHSQAEGTAGSSPMLQAAPWLHTKGGVGGDKTVKTYKNIKVFTSALPWPEAAGTPILFTPGHIGVGAWLDMTLEFAPSPLAAHPYSSPYQYPNTRSIPVTPSRYQAIQGEGGGVGGGSLVGVELPLCWKMSQHFGEPLYLVKLAIPASLFLRYDQGLVSALVANYAWWSPLDNFDWHPTTQRLYQSWKQKMAGAAALLDNDGDKLDIRLVVLWVGDNDSNLQRDRVREFEKAYKLMIRQIRSDLVTNEWTSLPEHQIPIAMMGIYDSYNGTGEGNPAFINGIMSDIQKDDHYTKWINTNAFSNLASYGYTDPIVGPAGHISHVGYLDAAEVIYDEFVTMEAQSDDAFGLEDRVVRSQVRTRVQTYYERGRVKTDAPDDVVNQHLNAALQHILNTVGDQAWWLRRMTTMTLGAGPTTPVVLPKVINRILRIERAGNPGYPLQFELQGKTQGGKLQILLQEGFTGSFKIHYITEPKELTRDDQMVPLPYTLMEWLVVETCRRLARAANNQFLHDSYLIEAKALEESCQRNIGAHQRARKDRFATERRLPTKKNMHHHRFFPPTV